MRKTILFIAMSLDGYIADRGGGTGWLEGQAPGGDDLASYRAFVREVDTGILGANTYRQITEELPPGEWAYPELTSYVVTHARRPSTEKIRFTAESPVRLVTRLREEPGKSIWICGGASVAQQLIGAGLIEQYYINVIPTILGGGIRLFGSLEREQKLRLIKSRSYNGITDLVYERRPPVL